MSPDLYYLLMSAVLCFVQMLIAATGANTQVGLPKLAGNRDQGRRETEPTIRATSAHESSIPADMP